MFFRCNAEKVRVGTFTASTSATTTVDLGFKPKYLICRSFNNAKTYYSAVCYDEDVDPNYIYTTYVTSSAGSAKNAIPNTASSRIGDITNTGFVYNKQSTNYSTTVYYYAIG